LLRAIRVLAPNPSVYTLEGTNTWVVGDGPTIVVDPGPDDPAHHDEVLDTAGEVAFVLVTHDHEDHGSGAATFAERAHAPLFAWRLEGATRLKDGQRYAVPGADLEAVHTPGHTRGMLSLVVDGTDVFTGDTLFKNSVGGVRAPGHTTYADLKHSIMDVLLELPPETTIRPGHTEPTTVAEERESNAFVRVWRGLDPEGDEQCTAMGEPATLVLLGDDYDGGHKAWVRWPDGADDIVPGSQVQRR